MRLYKCTQWTNILSAVNDDIRWSNETLLLPPKGPLEIHGVELNILFLCLDTSEHLGEIAVDIEGVEK